jgi:hypothetical protein
VQTGASPPAPAPGRSRGTCTEIARTKKTCHAKKPIKWDGIIQCCWGICIMGGRQSDDQHQVLRPIPHPSPPPGRGINTRPRAVLFSFFAHSRLRDDCQRSGRGPVTRNSCEQVRIGRNRSGTNGERHRKLLCARALKRRISVPGVRGIAFPLPQHASLPRSLLGHLFPLKRPRTRDFRFGRRFFGPPPPGAEARRIEWGSLLRIRRWISRGFLFPAPIFTSAGVLVASE